MSNRVHSLAKSRIIWIANKKDKLAPVWVISRSRSKTDGFPSQMVGAVLFYIPLPVSLCFSRARATTTSCMAAAI